MMKSLQRITFTYNIASVLSLNDSVSDQGTNPSPVNIEKAWHHYLTQNILTNQN